MHPYINTDFCNPIFLVYYSESTAAVSGYITALNVRGRNNALSDNSDSSTMWLLKDSGRWLTDHRPHLQYVAALPCEIQKSKNVT